MSVRYRVVIGLTLAWACGASLYAYRAEARRLEAERRYQRELQAQAMGREAERRAWCWLVFGRSQGSAAEAEAALAAIRHAAPATVSPTAPLLQLCQQLCDELKRIEQELHDARRALIEAQTIARQRPPQQDSTAQYVAQLHQERIQREAELMEVIEERDRQIQSLVDRVQTLAERLRREKHRQAELQAEMLREVDRLRTAIAELRRYRPEATAASWPEPDGRIVHANNVKKLVWINLGRRHGIEPGMTFSVWPAQSEVALDRAKARIMVTRIIDSRLSEARIVERDPRRPVVDGDLICNAAWDPDRPVCFVLAGLIDLDGDGRDDRQLVRRRIEAAGGKVIAELLPDGSVRGQIRAEVRYFVRGIVKGGLEERFQRLEQEARDFGAYVLTIDKLADLLALPRRSR